MKLTWHALDLPLRHEFTISRGSTRIQPTLVVQLQDGPLRGYGEATANSYYGASVKGMIRALTSVRSRVQALELADPEQFWQAMHKLLANDNFALCALDEAAWDLWGKSRGEPLYRLWGAQDADLPLSSYTIGIDSIEKMLAKLREFPAWPIYKIKLGTPHDLRIISALREHTDAVLRVDANGGWTFDQALRNAFRMKSLGVQFIEQPLAASDWDGMRRLLAESPLPLIADESCVLEADVERCVGHFHGINVKTVKCGGLTPARRMLARARTLGLRTMIGCMTESSVGISAVAQLLPLVDYADLDGALLLARDIASGVTIERGVCRYAKLAGTGVELLVP